MATTIKGYRGTIIRHSFAPAGAQAFDRHEYSRYLAASQRDNFNVYRTLARGYRLSPIPEIGLHMMETDIRAWNKPEYRVFSNAISAGG